MSDTAQQRPRASWLLIVSLCGNVALAAIVVMGILSAARHATLLSNFSPQSLMEDASYAERGRLRAILEGHAPRLKALRMADLGARRELLDALRASALDISGFAAALKKVRSADDALRQEQEVIAIAFVSQLSPDERRAMAEKVRRRAWWIRTFRGHFGAS
ncbi:MAG: periplasmic heavy metal sensor [Alphaproteobacteria bacterium]|nr:periplasmic heavy metal sensor [Alphaproteobacteria bacterium]